MLAKACSVLGFEADKKIAEVDRHQDRHRDQKADQQFACRGRYIRRHRRRHRVRPQMAADVGDQPETVEAECDDLEPGAATRRRRKLRRSPVKATCAGIAGGTAPAAPVATAEARSGSDSSRRLRGGVVCLSNHGFVAESVIKVSDSLRFHSDFGCRPGAGRDDIITPSRRTARGQSASGGSRWCRRRSRRAWRRAAGARSDTR